MFFYICNKTILLGKIDTKSIYCTFSDIKFYRRSKITLTKKKTNDFDQNIELTKISLINLLNINKFNNNHSDIIIFLKEIYNDVKRIEWPTIDKLFKQFVIVSISLVSSALFIYSVDGLFAWGSKFLFESEF
nr:preprotein translocase secE subunit [Cryptomonas sp.]